MFLFCKEVLCVVSISLSSHACWFYQNSKTVNCELCIAVTIGFFSLGNCLLCCHLLVLQLYTCLPTLANTRLLQNVSYTYKTSNEKEKSTNNALDQSSKKCTNIITNNMEPIATRSLSCQVSSSKLILLIIIIYNCYKHALNSKRHAIIKNNTSNALFCVGVHVHLQ